MKQTIKYEEAKVLWDKYLTTPYLKLHTLESEAIMRQLARHYGEDEEFWGITGLLHDLDMDLIGEDYSRHGYKTVELMREAGYEIPKMFQAIIAHTEGVSDSNATRVSFFDFLLAGAENMTGIISAYVAIKPDKKIAGTQVKSIHKKIKSKAFAAGVNRQFISDVTDRAGLDHKLFIELSIKAFEEFAPRLDM